MIRSKRNWLLLLTLIPVLALVLALMFLTQSLSLAFNGPDPPQTALDWKAPNPSVQTDEIIELTLITS